MIPCVYFAADDFMNGYAIVRKGEKTEFGIIDKSGKEILPCKYGRLRSSSYAFKVGVVILRIGDNSGDNECVIDIFSGKEIIPPMYSNITFDDELRIIRCSLNKEEHLFDFQGKDMGKMAKLEGDFYSFYVVDAISRKRIDYNKLIVRGKEVVETQCSFKQYDNIRYLEVTFIFKDAIIKNSGNTKIYALDEDKKIKGSVVYTARDLLRYELKGNNLTLSDWENNESDSN